MAFNKPVQLFPTKLEEDSLDSHSSKRHEKISRAFKFSQVTTTTITLLEQKVIKYEKELHPKKKMSTSNYSRSKPKYGSLLNKMKKALSHASVAGSSSSSSHYNSTGGSRSKLEPETALDRPLDVLRSRNREVTNARRTRSCAAEKENFSPRIVMASQARQSGSKLSPLPEMPRRASSAKNFYSDPKSRFSNNVKKERSGGKMSSNIIKAARSANTLDEGSRRKSRSSTKKMSHTPEQLLLSSLERERVSHFNSDIGLYPASPMSPPQRSLFRATRQQLAQQLLQTTASASKRWRIHEGEDDVETAPSPTYISYHQPSPQFDFGAAGLAAAAGAAAAAGQTPVGIGRAARREPKASILAFDTSRAGGSADSRRSYREKKVRDLTTKMTQSPTRRQETKIYYNSTSSSSSIKDCNSGGCVDNNIVRANSISNNKMMAKPARRTKRASFDAGRPRTAGAEEMQAYFKSLEGIKLVADEREGDLNRLSMSSSEAFLGIKSNPKTPVARTSSRLSVAKKKSSGKKPPPPSSEKIEKALQHWTECLTDFVQWADGAVKSHQTSSASPKHDDHLLVEEMACALAGMPNDLKSAIEAYDRHLRMESAKKRAIEEEQKAERAKASEVMRRSRANLGIPERVDPMTCDLRTICKASAAEMYSRTGEITDRDVYGRKRGKCNNCSNCDPGFICYPTPLAAGGSVDLAALLNDATRVLCLYCDCPPAFHTLVQETNLRFEPSGGNDTSMSSNVSMVKERVRDFEGKMLTQEGNRWRN